MRVVHEDSDALIRIAIITSGKEKHPDITGFTIQLAVEQTLFIER